MLKHLYIYNVEIQIKTLIAKILVVCGKAYETSIEQIFFAQNLYKTYVTS